MTDGMIMTWKEFCEGHYNGFKVVEKDGKEEKIVLRDKKSSFRRKLIDYWIESCVEGYEPPGPNAHKQPVDDALEMLFEKHRSDIPGFMRIVNFTSRNSKQIVEDLANLESKYMLYVKVKNLENLNDMKIIAGIEDLGEDIGKIEDLEEVKNKARNELNNLDQIQKKIKPLKSLLSEWDDHRKNLHAVDSWENFIIEKAELSENPRYRATAIAQRVRRLRLGYKINRSIDLHALDRMIDTALTGSDKSRDKIQAEHAVLKGEDFWWTLKIQKILTGLYRNDTGIEDDIETFQEAMKHSFDDLLERGAMDPGIAVFYWWSLRIGNMRARSILDFEKGYEYDQDIDQFKKQISDETRILSYIESIEAQDPGTPRGDGKKGLSGQKEVTKTDLRKRTRDELLAHYHEALATFIKNPIGAVGRARGKNRTRIMDKWNTEGLLYCVSMEDMNAKGNSPIFVDLRTNKKDNMLARCKKSIDNARKGVTKASYSTSHTNRLTALLICIDLAIRIRWLLTINRSIKLSKKKLKGGAKEIKDGMANVLSLALGVLEPQSEVQKIIPQTETGNQRIEKDSILVVRILKDWIRWLEKMDHEDDPVKLFDICNKMVKWKEWEELDRRRGHPELARKFMGNQEQREMVNNQIKIMGDDDKVLTLSSRYNESNSEFENMYGIPYITRAGELTR